jgi:hypothetical protein
MTAHAFHYYIPSILTHVCRTGQYPEFALESLRPPAIKEAIVQDELKEWWKIFMLRFTPSQRAAVLQFIENIKVRDDLLSSEIDGLDIVWS